MKCTKLIIILIIIFFFIECENRHRVDKSDITEIAFPIEINEDETRVNISNYLSGNIKIIKAKVNENMICNILADSINIILKEKEGIKPFSNLHLKSSRGNIDFLLKLSNCCTGHKDAPYIYGEELTDEHLSFTIKNSYDKLFVYLNNKLLDNRKIQKVGDIYTVKIPKNAQEANNTIIRIYAYHNINGISNEFFMPIIRGKTSSSFKKIDSINDSYTNIQEFYNDEQYMQLYKEALRTFIYYKNDFPFIDSLVHKGIYKYGLYRNINQNVSKKYYTLSYSALSGLNEQIAQMLVDYKKTRSYKKNINNINQLNAFLMTIPGPPSFYIKPNKSENELSELEFAFIKLENLRKNNLPLIYGNYETIRKDDLTYAYVRKYFKQFCIVVFNKSKFMKKKKINLHVCFTDTDAKALFNNRFDITMGKLLIEMRPHSVEIIYGKIIK